MGNPITGAHAIVKPTQAAVERLPKGAGEAENRRLEVIDHKPQQPSAATQLRTAMDAFAAATHDTLDTHAAELRELNNKKSPGIAFDALTQGTSDVLSHLLNEAQEARGILTDLEQFLTNSLKKRNQLEKLLDDIRTQAMSAIHEVINPAPEDKRHIV